VVGSNWTFTVERRPDVIAAGYEEMSSWYVAGALRPRVSRLLPFNRAAEALRLLADRKAIGKIVLN
jgi:NADPH2:quinone reductase